MFKIKTPQLHDEFLEEESHFACENIAIDPRMGCKNKLAELQGVRLQLDMKPQEMHVDNHSSYHASFLPLL